MIDEDTLNTLRDTQIDVAQHLVDSGVIEALQDAQEYFRNARALASEQIDIEPPWDYDPSIHDADKEVIELSLKWFIESREAIEDCGHPNLMEFAERMEEAEAALVREGDDPQQERLYETIFLLMSIQDGFVQWLCVATNVSPDDKDDNGDPIYYADTKKSVLESQYDAYSVFEVENSGDDFKNKWENFFEHRHRVMHGHPDAFFDENLALTAVMFTTLTSYVALERWRDMQNP